ncbi:MAG: adenylate/guanylate cyclase domain-containing protein [Chloroflexi bacterium]|nr:adenylate/guanylate cyclase domain-containing protein [Chloroflexota bacterium]
MQDRQDNTSVLVIFFDDMRESTALKAGLTEKTDEHTFQKLRQEHDSLLTEIITRGDAGQVVKSTGDGLLAVFYKPSIAVERAVEIQERLHGHPHLSVRIGMDMGEVCGEYVGDELTDVFGRHVDWAARATTLADGGHISVTRSVYIDAFSWLTKSRIAWEEHGAYIAKPGEPPLDIFEPYNANITQPLSELRGTKVEALAKAPSQKSEPSAPKQLRLVRPWEAVARDGRDFAEKGGGMMYWFKVPLGGICYAEGFRSFLAPALENQRITKIRFLLDSSIPIYQEIWNGLVLPLLVEWATKENRAFVVEELEGAGRFYEESTNKRVEWVMVDLSAELSPCFKLFVDDPDNNIDVESEAQIFLSSASRTVRLGNGALGFVRIPDAVLRIGTQDDEALIHTLNSLSNQWDALFS